MKFDKNAVNQYNQEYNADGSEKSYDQQAGDQKGQYEKTQKALNYKFKMSGFSDKDDDKDEELKKDLVTDPLSKKSKNDFASKDDDWLKNSDNNLKTPGSLTNSPAERYAAGHQLTDIGKSGQGADISINGSRIHLDPGTSVTVGKDGQLNISSNKLSNNSVMSSNFPGSSQLNQEGFNAKTKVQQQNYSQALNQIPNDPNAAYKEGMMKGAYAGAYLMSNQMRKGYQAAGMSNTANAIGYDQRQSLNNQLDNGKDQSKQNTLQVDKSNELSL